MVTPKARVLMTVIRWATFDLTVSLSLLSQIWLTVSICAIDAVSAMPLVSKDDSPTIQVDTFVIPRVPPVIGSASSVERLPPLFAQSIQG